jgi:hypothetical protein
MELVADRPSIKSQDMTLDQSLVSSVLKWLCELLRNKVKNPAWEAEARGTLTVLTMDQSYP